MIDRTQFPEHPELLRALEQDYAAAVERAWDALARYKFWMFGYYAARAVYVGQLLNQRNPFRALVAAAREHIDASVRP